LLKKSKTKIKFKQSDIHSVVHDVFKELEQSTTLIIILLQFFW